MIMDGIYMDDDKETGIATIETRQMAPRRNESVSVLTPDGFEAMMNLATTLAESGFFPKFKTPAQSLAVILAGQEIGMPPMKSLRSFHNAEGRISLSSSTMLELFVRRGGQSKWEKSDNAIAVLWLKSPSGIKHTETWTIEDAKTAGLYPGKDNWKKYPKAMLRARCEAFGLRAIGEADGFHDPDELGAETNDNGSIVEPTRKHATFPRAKPENPNEVKKRGKWTASAIAEDAAKRAESGHISQAQLALVHVLKAELGYSDEEWKSRLMAKFGGVDSSALLSADQASILIEALQHQRSRVAESTAEITAAMEETTTTEVTT